MIDIRNYYTISEYAGGNNEKPYFLRIMKTYVTPKLRCYYQWLSPIDI